MADSFDGMTIREKLTEADRLMREVIEHLDNGFIPKTRTLSRSLQEHGDNVSAMSDVTVRQQAAELIELNRFSEALYEKITALLEAIDHDVSQVQGGN